MNFSFEIVQYEIGRKTILFTIRIEGETQTEFEKFINDNEIKYMTCFSELIERLKDIMNRLGAEEKFFRDESNMTNTVVALCREKLRLYCCRYRNNILIPGGGGIKNTRTYQDDHKLKTIVEVLEYVSERIDQRIFGKELYMNEFGFQGNLTFEKE